MAIWWWLDTVWRGRCLEHKMKIATQISLSFDERVLCSFMLDNSSLKMNAQCHSYWPRHSSENKNSPSVALLSAGVMTQHAHITPGNPKNAQWFKELIMLTICALLSTMSPSHLPEIKVSIITREKRAKQWLNLERVLVGSMRWL